MPYSLIYLFLIYIIVESNVSFSYYERNKQAILCYADTDKPYTVLYLLLPTYYTYYCLILVSPSEYRFFVLK